jgi:hypothetical protein
MKSGTVRMREDRRRPMVAENVKGRGNFEVVGIDGIILKWFLMCA